MLLEQTNTDAVSTFLEETSVKDPTTQQWSIASWGSASDRCISPSNGGTACEVLTVKVQRTWSSYDASEDLNFSDG